MRRVLETEDVEIEGKVQTLFGRKTATELGLPRIGSPINRISIDILEKK